LEPPTESIQFAEVALPHLEDAYKLARWLIRDPNDAADVMQEAMLRAFLSVGSYPGGSGRAWMFAIVSKAAVDWLRVDRELEIAFSVIRAEMQPPDITNIACENDNAETALIRAGDWVLLEQLIARLPSDFRECLILREMQRRSYREIAEVLGIPIGTVMSRLSRAKRMIHRGWMKEEQGYARNRA
jgi:RNA polymerase sigma-70 factor, ECF subfamily